MSGLPPYTERRLGPERAALALRLRQRLLSAGLALPGWIDARPGRLQVLIGDLAGDPPLSRSAHALGCRHGEALVEGLAALMLASAAPRAVLAVRDEEVRQALARAAAGTGIAVQAVPAVWPSQPELDVAGAAGRAWVVPARQVAGAGAALRGQAPPWPCTVAGVVGQQQVLDLAPGSAPTPAELVRRCGGATVPAWVALAGAALQPWEADQPLSGEEEVVYCLPADHPLVRRLRQPLGEWLPRAAAVCHGCRVCSDGCPTHLAGAPLLPHRLMALAAEARQPLRPPMDSIDWSAAGRCAECGACDVRCPHGLSPRRLVLALRGEPPCGPVTAEPLPLAPHPEAARRRLPLELVLARLGLSGYAGAAGGGSSGFAR